MTVSASIFSAFALALVSWGLVETLAVYRRTYFARSGGTVDVEH